LQRPATARPRRVSINGSSALPPPSGHTTADTGVRPATAALRRASLHHGGGDANPQMVALEAQLRRYVAGTGADAAQSAWARVGVLELLLSKQTELTTLLLEHTGPLMARVPPAVCEQVERRTPVRGAFASDMFCTRLGTVHAARLERSEKVPVRAVRRQRVGGAGSTAAHVAVQGAQRLLAMHTAAVSWHEGTTSLTEQLNVERTRAAALQQELDRARSTGVSHTQDPPPGPLTAPSRRHAAELSEVTCPQDTGP
jgi:hypothetical protein